jgi:hypothetical protein
MNTKILIYSIPRKTATGLSEWTSPNGISLKKTKFGPACDTIVALPSPQVGGLKTGLYKP